MYLNKNTRGKKMGSKDSQNTALNGLLKIRNLKIRNTNKKTGKTVILQVHQKEYDDFEPHP
jgi:hypothetical protein